MGICGNTNCGCQNGCNQFQQAQYNNGNSYAQNAMQAQYLNSMAAQQNMVHQAAQGGMYGGMSPNPTWQLAGLQGLGQGVQPFQPRSPNTTSLEIKIGSRALTSRWYVRIRPIVSLDDNDMLRYMAETIEWLHNAEIGEYAYEFDSPYILLAFENDRAAALMRLSLNLTMERLER